MVACLSCVLFWVRGMGNRRFLSRQEVTPILHVFGGGLSPPPPAPEASSMWLPSPPLPPAPSAAAAAAARPGSGTAAGPDRPPQSEDGWGTLRHPPPAHGWALAQTTRSPSWPRHLGTQSPILALAFSAGADSSGGSIKFSRDFDWDSYFFSAK